MLYGSRNEAGAISIWRADLDGNGAKQLSTTPYGALPDCTPDGQSVIYLEYSDSPALMRVSIDGGTPSVLIKGEYYSARVSPDGKYIAAFTVPDIEQAPKLAIIGIEGGDVRATYDLPKTVIYQGEGGHKIEWTKDGRNVIFMQQQDETVSLWAQPVNLTGGPNVAAKRIMSFPAEMTIWAFTLSPDGKQILFAQGRALPMRFWSRISIDFPEHFMKISRRDLLKAASLASRSARQPARLSSSAHAKLHRRPALPPAFDSLAAARRPSETRNRPEEYQQRVARAQKLMSDAKPQFQALYIAPGTSLAYFTGIRWWPSERILAFLIPRQGDPFLVCLRIRRRPPARAASLAHRNPHLAGRRQSLRRRRQRPRRPRLTSGPSRRGPDHASTFSSIACAQAAARLSFVSAEPGHRPVPRAEKPARIGTHAPSLFAATFDVYKALFASLKEGMTQREVGRLLEQGFAKMDLQGGALVLFGPSAALPHGTREEQILREGMGILIDGGTTNRRLSARTSRAPACWASPPKNCNALSKSCAARRTLRSPRR